MINQREEQEFLEYITEFNYEELLGYEYILKKIIMNLDETMKQQRERAKRFLKMVQDELDLRERVIYVQSTYLH